MSIARYLSKLGALLGSDGKVSTAAMARQGSAGQVLTSNGAGADPSYQAVAGGVTTVDGVAGAVSLAALAAFTKSLSSSGYQKLPGGLIMQWGTTGTVSTANNITANQGPISFPIAFPSGLVSLQGTAFNASAISGGGVMSVVFNNVSASSFYWQLAQPNNGCNSFSGVSTRWLAFGY